MTTFYINNAAEPVIYDDFDALDDILTDIGGDVWDINSGIVVMTSDALEIYPEPETESQQCKNMRKRLLEACQAGAEDAYWKALITPGVAPIEPAKPDFFAITRDIAQG